MEALSYTKYTYIRVIFLLIYTSFSFENNLYCQSNLIKNNSFEFNTQIPVGTAGYVYCIDWWKPYIMTTDYFTNLISSSNVNFIPTNIFGYQESSFGEYYIGLSVIDWYYNSNNYGSYRNDYAGGKFINTLKKNNVYQFEFWMSKANYGIFKTNAIDLILTYDTIVDVNNFEPYGYKIWSEEEPMTDTINWVKISTCFKAKGNEKAFAIGNFHELSEIVQQVTYDSTTSGEIDYRYLDNFSLIECPTCCPDQFPPEQHVYVFSSPSAQNSPTSLQVWLSPNTTGELKIYDSAGRLVAKKSYAELENNFVFENFAAGIYHFALSTSDGVLENGKVMVKGE